ncbi:hypothetical protein BDB01DRAFT_779257 [Pilobolus umbonatus]|nr:hypothetical protein BDB01DRAFT_779257 [Pilobolus umbonatus]
MVSQLLTPPCTPINLDEVQCPTQLAEFASSMVYLMWHARKATNNHIQQQPIGNELAYLMWQARKPSKIQNYTPFGDQSFLHTASPAFKKFCYQVLTATQLQESAVYLSLKYIAILLQSNPSIEGAEGSEYRLFTVALMLANKFLDDNTFTNKTWSDVSGMKIHDLNIMEIEFLEALDYNLFVREHEYGIWKQLLEQCRDTANKAFCETPQQRQRLVLMTLKTLGLYTDHQHPIHHNYAEHNTVRNDKSHYMQQFTVTDMNTSRNHGIDGNYGNSNYNYYPNQQPVSFKYYQEDGWNMQVRRLELENSYRRYQQYLQQSMKVNNVQIPNIMQPSPVGYGYNTCGYLNEYPITNLSQSAWDPLAYSLNRCQDIAYGNQNYNRQSISWRNFT